MPAWRLALISERLTSAGFQPALMTAGILPAPLKFSSNQTQGVEENRTISARPVRPLR